MKLQSLGYRSDLIFTKFDGEVSDRGSYLVVRTLTNPNYFWGNLLIFDRVPRKGDFARWKSISKAEFTDPRIYHMTFAWDTPTGDEGDVSEFLAEGFRLERGVCLTARSIHLPAKHHPDLVVHPIETDQEWEDSIQIQISCGNDSLSKQAWEGFYRNQMDRYRNMVKTGIGHWFGGWLGGKMVAGLGLFRDGNLGRYQLVSTHPSYQRQGVCGSLVFLSAKYGMEKMGLETLVMVADEEYHAARIYETVGFKPTEKMLGVCWWDKSRTKQQY